MRLCPVVLAAVALGGCALLTPFEVTKQTRAFHPFAMNLDGTWPVVDQKGMSDDDQTCSDTALNHKHPFSVGKTVFGGVQGALSEVGAATVAGNPLVVGAGAGGGAGGEALKGFGLDLPEREYMKAQCMDDLGLQRKSYRIIDPIMRSVQ